MPIMVSCRWDPEAEVWYVEKSNVSGLVTEAATRKEMERKLQVMIPELLELNENHRAAEREVPLELVWAESCRLEASFG